MLDSLLTPAITDINSSMPLVGCSPDHFDWLNEKGPLFPTFKSGTTSWIPSSEVSVVLLIDGRPIVLSQLLSDNSVVDAAHVEANPDLSLTQRLDSIKDRLSISITQLAELFGVTRKTVYDWYEGQAPRQAMVSRIRALESVLAVDDRDLTRLKTAWNIALPGGSFLQTLQSDMLTDATLSNTLAGKLQALAPEILPPNGRQARSLIQRESSMIDLEHDNDTP